MPLIVEVDRALEVLGGRGRVGANERPQRVPARRTFVPLDSASVGGDCVEMGATRRPFESMLPDIVAAMGSVLFAFDQTKNKRRLRPREMVLFAADMASVARQLGLQPQPTALGLEGACLALRKLLMEFRQTTDARESKHQHADRCRWNGHNFHASVRVPSDWSRDREDYEACDHLDWLGDVLYMRQHHVRNIWPERNVVPSAFETNRSRH